MQVLMLCTRRSCKYMNLSRMMERTVHLHCIFHRKWRTVHLHVHDQPFVLQVPALLYLAPCGHQPCYPTCGLDFDLPCNHGLFPRLRHRYRSAPHIWKRVFKMGRICINMKYIRSMHQGYPSHNGTGLASAIRKSLWLRNVTKWFNSYDTPPANHSSKFEGFRVLLIGKVPL